MVAYEDCPTRVRPGVMGYLCSLAFILYVDRLCIGQHRDEKGPRTQRHAVGVRGRDGCRAGNGDHRRQRAFAILSPS